jgi:tetratricopeptide (TPR) repeat protein
MWLDAEDVIAPGDAEAVRKRLDSVCADAPENDKAACPADIIFLKYFTEFDNAGRPVSGQNRERIFRKARAPKWQGRAHEFVDCAEGKSVFWDAAVFHKSERLKNPLNLKIYQKMLKSGHLLSPRERYLYARELMLASSFLRAATEFEEFLESGKGTKEHCIAACLHLGNCYFSLNKPVSALRHLFSGFTFDKPRAEACCMAGKYFLSAAQYDTAVFWYTTALTLKPDFSSGAFVRTDCYGYTPAAQLTVCYDRLGMLEKALEYNALARTFKPDDPACEYYEKHLRKKLR